MLEQHALELSNQREWFRVTLASIGDAVIATDPEGRVAFMNEIARRLTGWTAEQGEGQPLERSFESSTKRHGFPWTTRSTRSCRPVVSSASPTKRFSKQEGGRASD